MTDAAETPENANGNGNGHGDEAAAFNAIDELQALAGSQSVSFERTGGGSGPGWNGDTYEGLKIQLGHAGSYRGASVDALKTQLQGQCGGGLYGWSGINSKGKRVFGELRIAGAPKQLPGVDDPAADRLAAQAAAQAAFYAQMNAAPPGASFGSNPGFGGFGSPQGFAYGQSSGGVVGAPPGWNFNIVTQQFWWNPEGTTPSPTYPPPKLGMGGMGMMGGGFGNPFAHQDDDRLKKLEEANEKLRGELLENARNAKHTDPAASVAALMTPMMTMMMTAMGSVQTTQAAARASEEASRREIFAAQQAIADRAIDLATKRRTDDNPLNTMRDSVAFVQELREGFGLGDANKEGGVAEKILDGVKEFLDLGKVYLQTRTPEEKAAAKKPSPQPPHQPQAPAAPAQTSGAADERERWFNILEYIVRAYQSGVSPQIALNGMDGVCHGAGISFENLLRTIAQLDAKTLLVALERSDERAKPLVQALGTADGQSWFNRLMSAGREYHAAITQAAAAPQQGGSPPGSIDATLDPPLNPGEK